MPDSIPSVDLPDGNRQIADTKFHPLSSRKRRFVTTVFDERTQARRASEALGMLPTMLARALGPDCRIRTIDHRPSQSRSTFAMEEIDVLLANGELLRLMLKALGPRGLLRPAHMAKPLFLHDPLREIEFQQHILSPRPELGTPKLFSTVVEPSKERYWMLTERVIGSTLEGTANLDRWQLAARWLAGMHHTLHPLASEPPASGTLRLLTQSADMMRMWIGRAVTVVPVQDPFLPRSLMTGLQQLADRYDTVVERLLAMPRTVIHGEFFGSNIVIRPDRRMTGINVVDWEMVAFGPPLMDLAALCAGERIEARRRELAFSYHAALAGSGLVAEDHERFLEDLDYCRLHLAIQWLGWSPDARPRRVDAHRWLEEVLELAGGLGLLTTATAPGP